jgi:hypothetical protein
MSGASVILVSNGRPRPPRASSARTDERKNNALLKLFKKGFVQDATSLHITNALTGKTRKDNTELVCFQLDNKTKKSKITNFD